MVFNKIDLIDEKKLSELKNTYADMDPVWISVHEDIGLDGVKEVILGNL